MTGQCRRAGVLAAVLLLGAAGLASCSRSPADSIDYAVDGPLGTYNTNTVEGAASGAPQAFARVLTGFSYHGPDGQIVGERARAAGIDTVVFDRGGFLYHGRVRAVAEGARESGLVF